MKVYGLQIETDRDTKGCKLTVLREEDKIIFAIKTSNETYSFVEVSRDDAASLADWIKVLSK